MFKESLGRLTRGEDLGSADVVEFVENMRDDVITDVQIAGFLVGLVMKGPTVDEVAAIARTMRNCSLNSGRPHRSLGCARESSTHER